MIEIEKHMKLNVECWLKKRVRVRSIISLWQWYTHSLNVLWHTIKWYSTLSFSWFHAGCFVLMLTCTFSNVIIYNIFMSFELVLAIVSPFIHSNFCWENSLKTYKSNTCTHTHSASFVCRILCARSHYTIHNNVTTHKNKT